MNKITTLKKLNPRLIPLHNSSRCPPFAIPPFPPLFVDARCSIEGLNEREEVVIKSNHLVLIKTTHTKSNYLPWQQGRWWRGRGARGASFTKADGTGDGEEGMASAGWGEGTDDDSVIVRDGVVFWPSESG